MNADDRVEMTTKKRCNKIEKKHLLMSLKMSALTFHFIYSSSCHFCCQSFVTKLKCIQLSDVIPFFSLNAFIYTKAGNLDN